MRHAHSMEYVKKDQTLYCNTQKPTRKLKIFFKKKRSINCTFPTFVTIIEPNKK